MSALFTLFFFLSVLSADRRHQGERRPLGSRNMPFCWLGTEGGVLLPTCRPTSRFVRPPALAAGTRVRARLETRRSLAACVFRGGHVTLGARRCGVNSLVPTGKPDR